MLFRGEDDLWRGRFVTRTICDEDEDVLEALRIQAKRQASAPSHFEPPVGTDAVAARESRSDNPVVFALENFLALVTDLPS